ncbi:hypothetical protein [Pseudomonas sp. Fl4BN1]|uniref:hypothetical protein n=1 Tax=Pseudomonas sp. Fl4BN1 TaxID=2697651 RepID=UPI0013790D80|nr:hypothetical protein [Pseudomonas sp. Fl4BN1]NBF11545.1 hypothetical protein [Pseudomonas sp. Fl4BN1]
MNKLPYFDPYPIQERDQRPDFEQARRIAPAMMSHQTPPAAPRVAGSAEDFLMHAIDTNGACGGLSNHLEGVLEDSPEYDQWVRSMPAKPADSPLNQYKNNTSEAVVAATDAQLQGCPTLSGGQVLFHGGQWPCEGDSLTSDRALSLSLSASVAVCETREDEQKEVWLITVDEACTAPVFVYDGRSNDEAPDGIDHLRHEWELLVRAGARFERQDSKTVQSGNGEDEYRVHYVTMR